MNQNPTLLVGVGLLAASGLIMALALRRRFPRAWWLAFGWPVLLVRMHRTWHELTTTLDLTTSRKPKKVVLGDMTVKGEPVEVSYPVLHVGFPRRAHVTVWVRMLHGQVPSQYEEAVEAFTHSWEVHSVRVVTARGASKSRRVRLLVVFRDPLLDVIEPPASNRAPAVQGSESADAVPGSAVVPRQRDRRAVRESAVIDPAIEAMLRVRIGTLDDGEPWFVDFLRFPHWLVMGTTLSGKSTFLNALIVWLSAHPVALVGIDLKFGIELGPYRARLSALATTREDAVELLEFVLAECRRRGAACTAAGVKKWWQLPAEIRPVPMVVIVDELAEVAAGASRAEQEMAVAAVETLRRLASLGASMGVYLVISGQRIASELGKNVTMMRSELGGRVCHRVNAKSTAEMVFGDLYSEAVDAVMAISEEEAGVAITNGMPGSGWMRARAAMFDTEDARWAAQSNAHLRQEIPGIPCATRVDTDADEEDWTP